MKSIDFLRTLQKPSGAFLGWPGGPIYPEITGYLIPTLIVWNMDSMANLAAMYLIDSQNEDGSWNGIDGKPAAFDTSACVEGLLSTGQKLCIEKAKAGIAWVKKQKLNEIYHLRTRWICGIPFDGSLTINQGDRVHYLAYAIEGAYRLNHTDMAKAMLGKLPRGMQPRLLDRTGSDTCATAQIAYMRAVMGLDYMQELNAVRGLLNDDGSLPHDLGNPKKVAWAVKFYLDAEYMDQQRRMT